MAQLTPSLRAPEPLNAEHQLKGFDCGREALNEWLVRRAWRNQKSGDSRTYVVCNAEQEVVAFYSLAAGQIARVDVHKPLQRNAPDPISVIVLGRLAIASSQQGQGLGSALLRDAVYRSKAGANVIGARAVLVHALDEQAKAFYMAHGFEPSVVAPLTLTLAFKHLN